MSKLTCYNCNKSFNSGTVHDGRFLCKECSPNGQEIKKFPLMKKQEYVMCLTCGFNTVILEKQTINNIHKRTYISKRNCINPDCNIKNVVSTYDDVDSD